MPGFVLSGKPKELRMNIPMKKQILIGSFLLCNVLSIMTKQQPHMSPSAEDIALLQTLMQDPQFRIEILEQALTEVLNNFDRCEYILEHIAQIINSDTKGKYNKTGLESIKKVKSDIRAIRETCFDHITESILGGLIDRNSKVISYLATVFDSKLKKFPQLNLNVHELLTRSTHEAPTIEALDLKIQRNNMYLDKLYQEADNVGLSFMNKAIRKLESIDHTLRISSIIKRTLPYMGLFTYLVLSTDKAKIDALGNKPLSKFKSFIGGLPSEVRKQTTDTSEPFEANAFGQSELDPFRPTLQINTLKPEKGLLGSPLYTYASIIKLSAEPLLQFSVPALMLPVIKKDLNDLWNWITKKSTVVQNNLRGSHAATRFGNEIHKPRITFDDLVGLDDAKEILRDVVRYICDPERYDRSGTAIGKGYILSGPTRTGKTYIAEALAGEINLALSMMGKHDKCGFKEIKWWDLMQKDGIKAVIEAARKDAPCVLFIDEIDLLNLRRTGGDTVTLSEFLTGMSGLNRDDKNRIILIAATNKIEHIEGALLQHGRFGTIIHFENPRLNDRIKFFEVSLKKLTLEVDDFDLMTLARATEGASFGDLEAIIRFAQFKAKTAGERLSQKHLNHAINQKSKHIMSSDFYALTQSEKQMLSAYFAGVALTHLLADPQQTLQSVTIRPISKVREKPIFELEEKKKPSKTIKYGKVFTYSKNETLHIETKKDKLIELQLHCAGHIAQEILCGSRSSNFRRKDKQRALDAAKSYVFDGMKESRDNLSKQDREKLLAQAFALVEKIEKEMYDLLLAHKDDLALIAQALEEYQVLTNEQIATLLQTGSLPNELKEVAVDLDNLPNIAANLI